MEVRRVHQRNRGLYLSACASYRAAKPRLGISLRTPLVSGVAYALLSSSLSLASALIAR